MGLLPSPKRASTDYMVKSVINRLKILTEWEHKATLAIVLCINNNLNADDLYISEAIVEEGPALKRFRPCARGSAHPYKKRMSHLRITLSDEF